MQLRNMNPVVTIGEMTPEELIAFREKYRLSQEQLAKELKVSRNTINRWENKKRTIPEIVDVAIVAVEQKLQTTNSRP
jgi:transcriptional regulator with XRE-family HTH domain